MNKIIFALMALCLLSACEDTTKPKSKTFTIRYEVTGSCKTVDITVSNETEDTEQHSDVPVPYTKTFTVRVSGESYDYYFAYISAQNNQDSGSVTSTIYVNDKVRKTATSTGAYVIATASDSVQ
jgi:hypothetical protein